MASVLLMICRPRQSKQRMTVHRHCSMMREQSLASMLQSQATMFSPQMMTLSVSWQWKMWDQN